MLVVLPRIIDRRSRLQPAYDTPKMQFPTRFSDSVSHPAFDLQPFRARSRRDRAADAATGTHAVFGDPDDRRRHGVLHDAGCQRQVLKPALSGAAAGLGAVGHAGAGDGRGFRPHHALGLVRTARRKMHVVRGIVLIASSLSFFSALKFLPLAEATALNYSTPMIVTLMAATFLQEHITIPRWAFVIAGFVGMLLIVRPGSEMLTPASLLGARLRGAVRDVPDTDAQARRRKLDGAAFFPALVGTLIMSALLPFLHYDTWLSARRRRDVRGHRRNRHAGALSFHPRIAARAGLGASRPSPTCSCCGRRWQDGWCSRRFRTRGRWPESSPLPAAEWC